MNDPIKSPSDARLDYQTYLQGETAQLMDQSGPLAEVITDFIPRKAQQIMAQAVAEAIDARTHLVVEAGTGVGKTFAYLVPACLSDKKIIVSTGTKHLQDQLFVKDLPIVADALKTPIKAALLKGRANYLCLHRLKQAANRPESVQYTVSLEKVRQWSRKTKAGDITELQLITGHPTLQTLVTSTAENCLGTDCPDYEDCHVVKARRKAQQADVVVINHHLLFADIALKDEGFGELLPVADAFIIDEAHQLPEVASLFFGQSVSSRQLLELSRDTTAAQLTDAADMDDLRTLAMQLETQVKRFRTTLDRSSSATQLQVNWYGWHDDKQAEALTELQEQLNALSELLQVAAERSEQLENCAERAVMLQARITQFTENDERGIYWLETLRNSFTLHITPLNVAEPFQQFIQGFPADEPPAWIFTSATLAVGQSFEHFNEQLGLTAQTQLQLPSPFDYRKQAMLYIPDQMPLPNAANYTETVVDRALPVLQASQGRAFVLFTSHRALREAAEQLREQAGDTFNWFVQGEAPKQQLIQDFRQTENSVLLGTASFWEGVDIKGQELVCVIIDKLPFASPSDPILQARMQALSLRGDNPFFQLQLPQAIIQLKQGVGRLIRSVDDWGVLMLCDPRLRTKGYARQFFQSLPSMPVTDELTQIQMFFTDHD